MRLIGLYLTLAPVAPAVLALDSRCHSGGIACRHARRSGNATVKARGRSAAVVAKNQVGEGVTAVEASVIRSSSRSLNTSSVGVPTSRDAGRSSSSVSLSTISSLSSTVNAVVSPVEDPNPVASATSSPTLRSSSSTTRSSSAISHLSSSSSHAPAAVSLSLATSGSTRLPIATVSTSVVSTSSARTSASASNAIPSALSPTVASRSNLASSAPSTSRRDPIPAGPFIPPSTSSSPDRPPSSSSAPRVSSLSTVATISSLIPSTLPTQPGAPEAQSGVDEEPGGPAVDVSPGTGESSGGSAGDQTDAGDETSDVPVAGGAVPLVPSPAEGGAAAGGDGAVTVVDASPAQSAGVEPTVTPVVDVAATSSSDEPLSSTATLDIVRKIATQPTAIAPAVTSLDASSVGSSFAPIITPIVGGIDIAVTSATAAGLVGAEPTLLTVSPATAAVEDDAGGQSRSSLAPAAIAGAAVGSIVCLGAIGLFALFVFRRRRNAGWSRSRDSIASFESPPLPVLGWAVAAPKRIASVLATAGHRAQRSLSGGASLFSSYSAEPVEPRWASGAASASLASVARPSPAHIATPRPPDLLSVPSAPRPLSDIEETIEVAPSPTEARSIFARPESAPLGWTIGDKRKTTSSAGGWTVGSRDQHESGFAF